MRGKNGSSRPRGPSIGGESMTTLFNDDPLMHGLALFGNGGQLGLLSHTPPSFAPGSYEVSHMKRARAGSISGRLRSASDLEEKGLIDKTQKGVLKDLIISGDSELQAALDLYDKGDASQLEALMENGLLDRRESFDLLDNLDFGIMELGMSDEEPSDSVSNSVSKSVSAPNATAPPATPATVPPPDAKGSNVDVDVGAKPAEGVGGPSASHTPVAATAAAASSGRATVSPPVIAAAAAAAAAAPASAKIAGARAAASVSPFRNSGKSGRDAGAGVCSSATAPAVAPAASVGQGQGGGDGVGKTSTSASKAASSEQEIDLAGEGPGHFDLGEMAFDATFDDEYAEQDDVDMKDGSGHMPSSSSTSAGGNVAAAAAINAAAVNTAVGPLRVTGSTSKDKLKLAPPNLISSRGAHRRTDDSDDSDDSDDERPLGRGRARARARARGRRELGEGHEDDSEDDDESDSDDSQDGGVGGRGRGSGVVMSDDEGGVGGKGAHGDVDAPGLGSFSTMGAVIGDFSPQFKFSFTDDIHLDLGGGLKDELRDLESFSPHGGADQHGRGALGLGHDDMLMGLSASRAQQLLSRGGPAVVKSELLSSSPSPLGATRSSTAAAALAKAAKAAAAGNADDGEDSSETGASSGLSGYATNHYASGAAYDVRHTGPYATAEAAASGGDSDGAEVGAMTRQARPQGSSAAAVAAAAAAAAAGGAQGGNLYGREGATAAGAATPTHHHAARGRPVVSGMEILVGGGPRMGMTGGADGEERKFVGAYSPESRRQRIERFLQKREKRVWTKMVKYDVRKNFADTRMRVKGRFVKKEDEALLREVMACA